MNATRHRLLATGLTTALVGGVLAVVPGGSPAHAAAPPTTAIAAAQVRATLLAIGRTSDAKAFRVGARAYASEQSAVKDRQWVRWSTTATLDVERRTMRHRDLGEGDFAIATVAYGACHSFGTWTVAKDKVGAWHPTERDDRPALKILGRPGAKWAKVKAKPALRKVWARDNVATTVDRYLDSARFGTATKQVAASSTVYVMPYTRAGVAGRITVTVDRDGALTKYRQVTDVARTKGSELVAKTYSYGAQTVRVPAKRKTVTAAALRRGCLADTTRSTVPYLAKFGAGSLNSQAKDNGERVSVADIREEFRYLGEAVDPALNIEVHRIKYGVQIVGRNKLLPHPYVWTVFVRNGKAVAHKVR